MRNIFRACLYVLISAIFLSSSLHAENTAKTEYRLQPTDVLSITVHNRPELTTKTRVTTDGSISFPLIGKVQVSGLTVQEVEQKIKELLEKDYLVSAEVLVFIEEYHARQVSVLGEVKNPGKYDMPNERDLTLMQAIAMAGGFTKHAETSKVMVMRPGDAKNTNITVNAKAITERGDKDKDIVLKPEDIIVVQESFF